MIKKLLATALCGILVVGCNSLSGGGVTSTLRSVVFEPEGVDRQLADEIKGQMQKKRINLVRDAKVELHLLSYDFSEAEAPGSAGNNPASYQQQAAVSWVLTNANDVQLFNPRTINRVHSYQRSQDEQVNANAAAESKKALFEDLARAVTLQLFAFNEKDLRNMLKAADSQSG